VLGLTPSARALGRPRYTGVSHYKRSAMVSSATDHSQSGETRGRLIEAITSPIGFFVLALLIVEAFLATVLVGASLEAKDKMIGVWFGVGMFVLVVIMVFILVCFRPQNFVFDRGAHLEQQKMEQERTRRASGGVELRELAPLLEKTLLREIASDKVAERLSQRSRSEVLGVLKEQAERIANDIRQSSFISVDLTAFGDNRGIQRYPVAALKDMNALTDEVYFSLDGAVHPYAYGTEWVLRDKATRRVFRTLRMLTGTPAGQRLPDTRSLEEVGIKPGMELEAIPPPAASRSA
jgi:uncharacterized membrane protein required for colicin V production